MDLANLLTRPEGKTLEFKRDLSSPDGIVKTAIAFANTAGGILLIGVEDGTRRVCGIADALNSEEKLANVISDNIQPPIVPGIEILPWRKLQVLAVHVHPSSTRPHFFRRLGIETGVFLRVGSTNRKADATQIEELRRFVRQSSFDEQPLAGTDSEAIDFRVASELFAPFKKLTKLSLQTLRLTTEYQGRLVATAGGILLFGKDRFNQFPDAWILAGRFASADKSKLIESVEIRSYPAIAVEEAINFLHTHLRREIAIGKVRRADVLNLPELALREAVINAVVHADYSQQGAPIRIAVFEDRVEIDNPGLLVFGLTIDDINRGVSRLRNRVIGRVFQELRLIEQWGSGIQRMTAACREAGLADPEFEEIGSHFRVTLRIGQHRATAADGLDGRILARLSSASGRSTGELAKALGVSTRTIRDRLKKLVERGSAVEVGSGRNDPQRRYFLPSRVRTF